MKLQSKVGMARRPVLQQSPVYLDRIESLYND